MVNVEPLSMSNNIFMLSIEHLANKKKKEGKNMENIMNEFTFFNRGKDYFVVTSRTKKTKKLAEKILPMIGASVTEGNIEYLLWKMEKAVCEIRTCNTDRKENRYYEISGENFGGIGSWIDDGETIILRLEN